MVQNKTSYNKIIGVTTDNELVILEYTFENSDNFKGATGYRMSTITEGYIEEKKSFDYADEYLWKDSVSNGYTDLGFEEWWEELVEDAEGSGYLYPYDDDSFRYETEELYDELSDEDRAKIEEVLGVKGEDYVTFESSSCGRCFEEDMEWAVLLEPELFEGIKRLEHKEPFVCAKCGKDLKYSSHYEHEGETLCKECYKPISIAEHNAKVDGVRSKVNDYLLSLSKEELIDLLLGKVSLYDLEDVCEKATGDGFNWVYLEKKEG